MKKLAFPMLAFPILLAFAACHSSPGADTKAQATGAPDLSGGPALAWAHSDGEGGYAIELRLYSKGQKVDCSSQKSATPVWTVKTTRNHHSDEDVAQMVWSAGQKSGNLQLKVDYQWGKKPGSPLESLVLEAKDGATGRASAQVCDWQG